MSGEQTLMETWLPLLHRRAGKVRDVYEALMRDGTEVMVLVATDRISAFDVVMGNGIPGKGRLLTQMSGFWFDLISSRFAGELGHHLLSLDPGVVRGLEPADVEALRGRVMVGRRTRVVPIECVARGYLAGSGWKEYQQSGTVCGVSLPAGLKQCDALPEPIFTPASKAEQGHDENITFERACDAVGGDLMRVLRDWTMRLYALGHAHARSRGVILADTKFEFGLPLDRDVKVPILIDEVMTPDSSRYWPAHLYEAGRDQPSFDKQYVRDYLQSLVDAGQWDKQPPGPVLPEDVVKRTAAKYAEAYERIAGDVVTGGVV